MHYLQNSLKFLSNKGFTSCPALFPPWGSHKVLGSKARSVGPHLSPNKQRDCFASSTEEIDFNPETDKTSPTQGKLCSKF